MRSVWFSIHDQMELLILLVMGRLNLRVQTVPAFDAQNFSEHTAYTVIFQDNKCFMCASGWTLRDAIELFCKIYQIERTDVCLIRPFFPQRMYHYE